MTDLEAEQFILSVRQLLLENDLQWVADQADEKIELGKVVTREVSSSAQDFALAALQTRRGKQRSRRSVEFTANEPYSPNEIVEIFLRAIEQALLAPHRMVEQMKKNIMDADALTIEPAVTFVSEKGEAHEVNLSTIGATLERAAGLEVAIREVRTRS